MDIKEYSQYDGLGLAELVRKREVSAKELATLALEGVTRLDPKINAVVETYEEGVADLDNGVDLEAQFAGVPFFIKDSGSAEAGQIQELGSRLAKGRVIRQEGFLARRFKDAGLSILGRTTVPEMASTCTTETVLNGKTRNPWNLELSSGGSTGGGGSVVSAGIAPLAHASDSGGSIRAPAALCALVGLKPSRGRITSGPGASEHLFGMTQEFVLSRTVRDTAAMLDAVGGPAVGDPFIIVQPSRPYLEEVGAHLDKQRIAFTTETWHGGETDPEMVEAVEEIARLCEDMGHIVKEAGPVFDFEPYMEKVAFIWGSDLTPAIDAISQEMGRPIDDEHLEHVMLEWYRIGKEMSVEDLLSAIEYYNKIRRQVGEFFEPYDLLLTPSAAGPAFPLGVVNLDQNLTYWEWTKIFYSITTFTELFNITGQPAISLPLAWTENELPLGIQFVAKFGQEDRLIRLASMFEEARPWRERIPPVHMSNL